MPLATGRMEQAGLIELPALRPARGAGTKREAVTAAETGVAMSPQCGALADLTPITLEPVTARAAVREWNATVERHHPLGYRGAFGFRLRYFIQGRTGCLGCILMSGAARAIAARDQWIGWDAPTRLNHLAGVVNNSRFLLLPFFKSLRLRLKALCPLLGFGFLPFQLGQLPLQPLPLGVRDAGGNRRGGRRVAAGAARVPVNPSPAKQQAGGRRHPVGGP